tara:strand:- start:42 stop:398 length:357 start_codon:yes stop_codon:yes gene_type:complete
MNKLIIVISYISLNILLLFIISPIIDHFFKDLDESESNIQILSEVIVQILTIGVIWWFIDSYILVKVKKNLDIHKNEIIGKVRDVVIAVIIVGLQSHLIHKLEYLSKKHPFKHLFLTE